MDIAQILSIITLIVLIITFVFLLKIHSQLTKQDTKVEQISDGVRIGTEKINDLEKESIKAQLETKNMLSDSLNTLTEKNAAQAKEIHDTLDANLRLASESIERLADKNAEQIREFRDVLDSGLKTTADSVNNLSEKNNEQLREIRGVVDDKLQDTLTKNLNESFQTVNEQLKNLYQSLGEMRKMNDDVTKNVGQLNRLMSNVKSRGTWAEVQLGNILDETIPGMYETNYKPVASNSKDVVEFAVKIPSQSGNITYLPLDSKLPIEDYARLITAQDEGNFAEADSARKALENRVLNEAKEVSKYICVPETTPYAIMYLATEGLYAEILSSRNGIYEKIRSMGVMVAGPNTITAILTSLSMGYRAIAVNDKADEIFKLLAVTRAQYDKYTEVLLKVKKNLDSASQNLELAQKRNELLTKKLKTVDLLGNDDPEVLQIEQDLGQKF